LGGKIIINNTLLSHHEAGWLACLVTCNILVVEERWVSMQESAPVGLMKFICDCRQTFNDTYGSDVVCFEECVFHVLFVLLLGMGGLGQNRDWISECLKLWASLPNCRYWNLQWASLIARCIKHSVGSVDWEPFLPTLFTSFLRSFEVYGQVS
jgi:hypothetical protein